MPTPNKPAQAPEYAYALATNSDDWSADDLAPFVSDNELAAGAVIARGVVVRPDASDFLPGADDIVNHMANSANDEHSEFCDGFPDVSDAATAELEVVLEALKAWADKHCAVTFYQVVQIESYTVTAEDRTAADQYLNQQQSKLA